MSDWVLWSGLFVIALIVGFYIGYTVRSAYGPQSSAQLHRNYLLGLNFLLNDQPEKAVDIFINMLAINHDTIETHIALGNLFRRRGEVDRALQIHQRLLERADLQISERVHALFELGQDYVSAGIVDRALEAFFAVIEIEDTHVLALKGLLTLHEQKKQWEHAIAAAKKLELATGKCLSQTIAQFYCEEAEVLHQKKEVVKSFAALEQAFHFDKRCVRASLQKGRYELEAGNPKAAQKTLKRIAQQSPEYLSEAIPMIVQTYEQDTAGLMAYIREASQEYPMVPFALVLSDRIREWQGEKAAAELLSDYLQRYPSFAGLKTLLALQFPTADGELKRDLGYLEKLLTIVVQKKPKYRCWHCGFSGRLLHWQCIRCKQWGVMKPIQGVDV